MERVIATERIPIKLWLNDIDDGALAQAKNLANLPFTYKHVAIMPDSHMGYGMPIGGVIATDGVIIPNAVGVDIGCGMSAIPLDVSTEELRPELLGIVERVREAVPVGFNRHSEPQSISWMPSLEWLQRDIPIVDREYDKALTQVGTLGGGNHFIEFQTTEDGQAYLMIHSGSRNIGKQVADHYNNVAKELNDQWYSQVPAEWQLAFLPAYSELGQTYASEMKYCTEFAKKNRELMMARILDIVRDVFRESQPLVSNMINIAHNYATIESHFGKNVWVHRKGATSAKDGELGIIPGSQGTASYIVRGVGNQLSFMSCSHGAGRVMGRKQAKRELNLAEEQRKLDEQGIIHSIRSVKDLDEATSAYKDIDTVMENQQDLVDVLVELKPLAVVKG